MGIGFLRALAALLSTYAFIAGTSARAGNHDLPAGVTAQEVRMPSESGVMLAGTLLTPQESETRPLPVVVLVGGTGAYPRGSPFAMDIQTRLLAHGIATVEYDKRGAGQSTGAFADTLPVMERDVEAVIRYLRGRSDLDAARVALIGVSQGGVAVPAIASRDPHIAAITMLSGPVGPRGELFLGIMRANLNRSGKSKDMVDRIMAATGQWMEARSRGDTVEGNATLREGVVRSFVTAGFTHEQAEGMVAALDTPVLLSMYEVAPDQALANVRAPVLAIYGGRDSTISSALSVPAAQAALADNPDSLVVEIPGADHTFRHVEPDQAEAPREQPISPLVGELIETWLAARLHAQRSRP